LKKLLIIKSLLPLLIASSLFGGSIGVNYVNSYRQKSGMKALHYSKVLSKASYGHAKYLGRLRLNSHTQSPRNPYFTGQTPSDRIARAGFGSRVGVENISFGERSYKKSVDNLFGTIYHRLAFLDFRIDSIGSSAYGPKAGKVYVYDMGSSAISRICKRDFKNIGGEYVFGVCRDKNRKIPLSLMQRTLKRVESQNSKVVIFPYSGAVVGRKFVNENPNPFGRKVKMGFPVSVELNPAFYSWAKLKRFEIFDGRGRKLKGKILDSRRDIHRKISPLTFFLIPTQVLKSGQKYRVKFIAQTNRGTIKREWSFRVK